MGGQMWIVLAIILVGILMLVKTTESLYSTTIFQSRHPARSRYEAPE